MIYKYADWLKLNICVKAKNPVKRDFRSSIVVTM